jgi:hypothetical protein
MINKEKLQFLKLVASREGKLLVNCKWQMQVHQTPILKNLLKRGFLRYERSQSTGRTRQTYVVLTEKGSKYK